VLPTSSSPTEVIPGYSITERIGTGGYGEVWRAEAPGGLAKAVKFVYGCLDDQRAKHELRALEHIKSVRHPFLLNLERIEVVDGQLVIITELADGSLKDRFDECRRRGLPGIPRDELLGYLHDAADALDYMSQEYSLQHLDVKPENLLTVGGRVKVADFGLVKDLHGRSISMLSGMTPVYAAPEVFDNRPSARSDQYSLAIVYQEMLTGALPFPGRTPAQLAAQHLGTKPQLTLLPAGDRPIVARALAKDPAQRWPSCRAMVDSLLDPARAGASVEPSPIHTDTASFSAQKSDTRTIALEAAADDAADEPDVLAGSRGSASEWSGDPWLARLVELAAAPRAEPQNGAPLTVEPAAARTRPTLIVGLGGTGLRTLTQLKRRLADRFGDAAALPALGLLAVDVDTKAIGACVKANDAQALVPDETLAVPLRRALDYRGEASQILRWMSRRWLFNLPRSQRTEGIRPLGRLALLDHRPRLAERIREALGRLRDPEALAQSAETTGMAADAEGARGGVGASTAGGAGGGMLADLAELVREVADAEQAKIELVGLLAHATPRIPSAKTLAVANTCACLSELDRHAAAQAAAGAAVRAGQAFDQTYLVHLGDDLDEQGYNTAAAELAEFLCLATVTPISAALERAWSADNAAPPAPGVPLRTFGMCRIGCSRGNVLRCAAESLARLMIGRWRGVTLSTASHGAAPDTVETIEFEAQPELDLDVGRLAQQVDDLLHDVLNDDPASKLATVLGQKAASAASRPGRDHPGAAVVEAVNEILGSFDLAADPEDTPPDSPGRALAVRLRDLASRQGAVVSAWILDLVETSSTRLQGAMKAAGWVTERLRQLENKLGVMQRQLRAALDQAERNLAAGDTSGATQGKGWLWSRRGHHRSDQPSVQGEDYFRLRLDELALRGAGNLLRSLRSQVTRLTDRLRDADGQLHQFAGEFESSSSWSEAIAAAVGPDTGPWHKLQWTLVDALRARLPELAAALDVEFAAELRRSCDGTSDLGLDGVFLARLRAAARRTIAEAVRTLNPAQWLLARGELDENPVDLVEASLALAQPRLPTSGATRRLLLACPPSASADLGAAIGQHGDLAPTVLDDGSGEVVFLVEAGRLSAAELAAALVANRPDFAELAARLHTRVDVPWSRLDASAE